MNSTSEELARAMEMLRTETHHEKWDYARLADYLQKLASTFERVPETEHRELIARIHDVAGRLPVIDILDSDFGALLLEHQADATADRGLKRWLYVEARYRASWCAQGGTAGGECIARYQHVKRLEEKLKNA